VRAHNVYGFGDWSDVVSITATMKPDKPTVLPTVAINNYNVRITWAAPTNNYESIDAYNIVIWIWDLSTTTELTYCDGSVQ